MKNMKSEMNSMKLLIGIGIYSPKKHDETKPGKKQKASATNTNIKLPEESRVSNSLAGPELEPGPLDKQAKTELIPQTSGVISTQTCKYSISSRVSTPKEQKRQNQRKTGKLRNAKNRPLQQLTRTSDM